MFVVGLEENLFPSPMASGSYRQLEEERRLFYVAITRAEEHCFLSFAKSRFKYGKMEFSNPSRFLRDIDARYLKLPLGENIPASPKRVISDAGSYPMLRVLSSPNRLACCAKYPSLRFRKENLLLKLEQEWK